MTSVEPFGYEDEWREQVLDLRRRTLGSSEPPETFDWWFGRNPAGPLVLSLAARGERLVGVSALSFLPMRIGGGRVSAAFIVDAATDAEHRGAGIWTALERRNEVEAAAAGAAVALGFTNAALTPIVTARLGWRRLARLRIWARPCLPSRGRPELAGAAEGRRFGEDAEELYRAVGPAWPNHVVREADVLNWRYVDSPRPYRVLVERRDRSLAGYAVVTHKAFGSRHVGAILDLVASEPSVARSLLRGCVSAIRGVPAVLALVSPHERSLYAAAGFLPTPRTLTLTGKPLGTGVELPARRRAWHLTLGDTDFF